MNQFVYISVFLLLKVFQVNAAGECSGKIFIKLEFFDKFLSI